MQHSRLQPASTTPPPPPASLFSPCSSLAALGLVENNAPNIVAAMLVSPLMGPVMSITFGAIISDRQLMVSAAAAAAAAF